MRKLRTFYGKVTEFLNDDKIPCLQRLGVYDYIDVPSKPFIYAIELVVYAKARQVWYTYILGSSDIWSDVNRDSILTLIQKH